MADPSSFTPFVPGFEFLQGLVKNAGAALPNMGQWVAPTFNPEELEKRIGELKTVQFWLEQNARLLGATIQALEVQRMTLSTLKTMNVQMGDLRDSMKIRMPGFTPAAADSPTGIAPVPQAPGEAPEAAPPAGAGVVDPMQWWGALTQQFTELATAAMKDHPVGAMAKQSMESASEGLRKAMGAPASTSTHAAADDSAQADTDAASKGTARKRAPPRGP